MSDAESRSSTAFFLALSGDVPASDALEFAAGVGLIRSEYVLRQAGSYVTTAAGRAALRDYAAKIAGLMDPKPVWVRTSDFEAREIATLSGCDAFEEDENPILGDRGIRRAQRYPRPSSRSFRRSSMGRGDAGTWACCFPMFPIPTRSISHATPRAAPAGPDRWVP